MEQKKSGKHVDFYGHVARFPKNVKAKSALQFLENVKVPKNRVWYLIVEKQGNELQMVKYNRVEGVDLHKFVQQLCDYYALQHAGNAPVLEALTRLEVSGEERFSVIRNISPVLVGGKPMITKIMEDLIKLLA